MIKFAVLFIILSLALRSYAEEKVLITVTGDARNFRVCDPRHPKGGMVPELVTTIIEKMGYRNQTRFLPWKRAATEARVKTNFALFPASKNLANINDYLLVPLPLYELKLLAIVPKDSKLKEIKRSDAKNLTTCELAGAVTLKKLGLNVIEVSNQISASSSFKQGVLIL